MAPAETIRQGMHAVFFFFFYAGHRTADSCVLFSIFVYAAVAVLLAATSVGASLPRPPQRRARRAWQRARQRGGRASGA